MLKRSMLIAAAMAAALVVGAAPAGAQEYPPANDYLTIDDVTPTPGQTVTITSGTYVEGGTVTVTITSEPTQLGVATVDANGAVTLKAAIPAALELGTHTITAAGTSPDGPLSQSITITVVAAGEAGGSTIEAGAATEGGGAAGGSLPQTGSNSTMPLARAAALLLAIGGVLTLATRRRRAMARAH